MDDFGGVLRGSWGMGCWCMFPRLGSSEGQKIGSAQRREAMTKLARRRRAPGLLAFDGDQAVGWIAVAPRTEYRRIEASRATPRVDDEDVWVIPCITVRPSARGRGIALALIKAAVKFAKAEGAPAVEAYPRAGSQRTKDDNAFFGTEPLFRRAGFSVIRKAPKKLPGNRVARVTMRKKV
jgi:GNAT superfamily N-acetyltransferase